MSIKNFVVVYCDIDNNNIDEMLLDGIRKAFNDDYDAIYEVYTTMKNHNLDTLAFLLLCLEDKGIII